MAKWVFYVLVLIYMCYRAVYGARVATSISVDQINYENNEYLKVGARQTVNCKGQSRNQKLEWIDPFGNVVKRIPSSRVYTQSFVTSPKGSRAPTLALIFSQLRVNDSGVYQCKSGDQKKSVDVCVIKPLEFIDTSAEVNIDSGRSISLTCQVKGEPEPQLVWKRNDEELTEGIEQSKYKVHRKYNIQGYESFLTITSVGPEDDGIYSCVAIQEIPDLTNCSHTDSMNVTLHVNYLPVFSGGNNVKNVYGSENEVVDIKCTAKGWPAPTYRWFKHLEGDALYEFENNKIKFSEDAAILPITAGITTIGSLYKCTAANSYGEVDKFFRLLKSIKPLKALEVVETLVTENSLYFNVSWGTQITFPVESFVIQYIEKSNVDDTPGLSDWRDAEEELYVIDNDEQYDELNGIPLFIAKIEDLDPATEYWVRLRATNAQGEAPWSAPVLAATSTKPESNTEELVKKDEGNEEVTTESGSSLEVPSDSGMFYGIFFAGGILIIAAVCMFAMRLV